jgi:protein TonB
LPKRKNRSLNLGNYLKLDVLALSVSVAIHLVILSLPAVREAIFPTVYQVVNVIPLDFDLKVESKYLGVKPSKRDNSKASSPAKSSLTRGKSSPPHRNRPQPKTNSTKLLKGYFKSNHKPGTKGETGSKTIKTVATGKGFKMISLSVSFDKGKKWKNPTVASNELVPYLIKLKDKIMNTWKPPYYKNETTKDRSAVIVLTIGKNGKLLELNVEKFSSDIAFNRSAVSAIYKSEPFPPLPKNVKVDKVLVKVKFEAQ